MPFGDAGARPRQLAVPQYSVAVQLLDALQDAVADHLAQEVVQVTEADLVQTGHDVLQGDFLQIQPHDVCQGHLARKAELGDPQRAPRKRARAINARARSRGAGSGPGFSYLRQSRSPSHRSAREKGKLLETLGSKDPSQGAAGVVRSSTTQRRTGPVKSRRAPFGDAQLPMVWRRPQAGKG